jgi:Uma2 family endonuclease
MSALPKQKWTVEEYLAMEAVSDHKHEFLNGEIFDMAGASLNHNRLVASIIGILHRQLNKTSCEVLPSDMRLKVKPTGLYSYPDVTVVCGDVQLDRQDNRNFLNPTVIVEVLSPSTEAYDRGLKFQNYRTLESLQEYLLISQDSARIEHYVRQGEQWLFTDATRLDQTITLSSINCTLLLSEVYEKVSFDEEA